MERVCHLISGGKADVRVAVLYHAEADWTIGKNQPCEVVGRILAEHQMDYHFIPSDVFEEKEKYHTSMDEKEKCLSVNQQAYSLLIVPESSYLPSIVAQSIKEMRQAGVSVWFINALPEGICSLNGTTAKNADALWEDMVVSIHELGSECQRLNLAQIHCSPSSSFIRCLHYIGEDYELYYIVNEAAEDYSGEIRFPDLPKNGTMLYRYDAWSNCCLPVSFESENYLRGTWEPSKGYIYVIERDNASLSIQPKSLPGETQILMLENWTRSVCFSTEYPRFCQEQAIVLPDEYEKEAPAFGGYIRYETELFCAQLPASLVELVIPGQQEGIEVFVNGVSAGIQIVPTYRFEISYLLRKGRNILRIEQATTLERIVPQSTSVSFSFAEPSSHLGINQIPYLLGFSTQEYPG